jgi:hypothetical protein
MQAPGTGPSGSINSQPVMHTAWLTGSRAR